MPPKASLSQGLHPPQLTPPMCRGGPGQPQGSFCVPQIWPEMLPSQPPCFLAWCDTFPPSPTRVLPHVFPKPVQAPPVVLWGASSLRAAKSPLGASCAREDGTGISTQWTAKKTVREAGLSKRGCLTFALACLLSSMVARRGGLILWSGEGSLSKAGWGSCRLGAHELSYSSSAQASQASTLQRARPSRCCQRVQSGAGAMAIASIWAGITWCTLRSTSR